MSAFIGAIITAILNWLSGRKKPNQDDANAIKQTRAEAQEMAQPVKSWPHTVDDL